MKLTSTWDGDPSKVPDGISLSEAVQPMDDMGALAIPLVRLADESTVSTATLLLAGAARAITRMPMAGVPVTGVPSPILANGTAKLTVSTVPPPLPILKDSLGRGGLPMTMVTAST